MKNNDETEWAVNGSEREYKDMIFFTYEIFTVEYYNQFPVDNKQREESHPHFFLYLLKRNHRYYANTTIGTRIRADF